MEKQIKKIVNDIYFEYRNRGTLTVAQFKQKLTKEIAALYEGWYPGEFVEWLFTNKDFEHSGSFFEDGEVIMFIRKQGLKEYTLPELFQYWQDNVEGK